MNNPETGIKISDWVAHHAASMPEKIATIDASGNRRQSYGEMNIRIGRIAAHLKSLGVEPGDRVGFLAMNTPDILDIIFATWRIGAVSLALNYRLSGTELAFIVNDATPKVMILDTSFAETGAEARAKSAVAHWIEFDGAGSDTPFERAIAPCPPILERIEQDMNAQALLMYSSGTTGKPKGVILTHKNLYFAAISGTGPTRNNRDVVALASMPMFHIGALAVSCLPIIAIGGTCVTIRAFDPGLVLDCINDPALGITALFNVPAAYNAMKQHPKAMTTDYSRLTVAIAGAETVPEALVTWWTSKGVTLQEGWGMTETSASGCLLLSEYVLSKPGSAGKPFLGSEIRIADLNGNVLPAGESGEIQMRGPVITPGYWNNPKATAEAFVGDWFRTGDIGRKDAEGFIYIEDRLKDMYISGGENVYPAEIENILYGDEDIIEVAVIGVPDAKWGEVGCAVVVPSPGKSVDLARIEARCNGQLAKYKWPAHVVELEVLPRNATGKVLKFELRKSIPALLAEAPAKGA